MRTCRHAHDQREVGEQAAQQPCLAFCRLKCLRHSIDVPLPARLPSSAPQVGQQRIDCSQCLGWRQRHARWRQLIHLPAGTCPAGLQVVRQGSPLPPQQAARQRDLRRKGVWRQGRALNTWIPGSQAGPECKQKAALSPPPTPPATCFSDGTHVVRQHPRHNVHRQHPPEMLVTRSRCPSPHSQCRWQATA